MAEAKKLVEDWMHSDVETTVYQLCKLLMSKDNNTCISLQGVLFINSKQITVQCMQQYLTLKQLKKTKQDMKAMQRDTR